MLDYCFLFCLEFELLAQINCQVINGSYRYLSHLLEFEKCLPIATLAPALDTSVPTPLKPDKWALLLSAHPDKQFVSYILQGIQCGFRIGFSRTQHLSYAPNRMSSHNHAEIIHQHLEREVKLGRMYKCPQNSKPLCVHTSPIGIIPKKNKPNKWRLIVDLSSLKSSSINDGIATELSSLCYTSVDHLSSIIISVGKGSPSEGRYKRGIQNGTSQSG